jgi:hypothetical protein
MAVIHISETETALSLADLIAKVRAGNRVEIESGAESFTIVPAIEPFPKGWTTLDALRQSEARGSETTLDDAFADDMEEIMRFNREDRFEEWESS